MGVVRIDDKLLKEIKELIEKGSNKYQYPSVAAFINNTIYEKLNKKKGVKNGSS